MPWPQGLQTPAGSRPVAEGMADLAGAAGHRTERQRQDDEDCKVTDPGVPRMTQQVIQECCLKNNGYTVPELNDVLMLQYKGFRVIEGLQEYTNVRSLFLECNGIRRIQHLEAMPHLVSLYLQSNCIERIENLDALTCLKTLNLAQNSITRIENLEGLLSLESLNLSANKIADPAALAGLVARRNSLKSVDLSCNYVEDGDGLLEFWPRDMPDVECLYLHHNTCSRSLKDYRRRLISGLPRLRWLDERPVTPVERVGCEAWAAGGKDAEMQAKADFWAQEREAKDRSFSNFRRFQQAAADRARAQTEAQAARELERQRAAAELEETGSLGEGWVELPAAGPGAKAEPERQQELHAKVEAFLSTRAQPAEPPPPTVAATPPPGPHGQAARAALAPPPAGSLSELD